MSRPEPQLSGNVFEDMAAFDRKYGFDKVEMTPKFLAFRMMFLIEELYEGILAIESNDPESLVDAMIDLIVVAAGTLSIAKVDTQKAWNEVRRANMSKVRGETKRSGSGGADLIKPSGWQEPIHTDNIGQFGGIDGKDFNQFFPHSITVLFACIHQQQLKYDDYNNGLDSIDRADYWIHGISSLEYEMHKKMLRFRSVLNKTRHGVEPKFESLIDSLLDDINYHSFAVAWLQGREPGQDQQLNLFGEQG